MLTDRDIEELNRSIKWGHAIYVIDQRDMGAFKGYKRIDEKILRYVNRVKKDLMLSKLSLSGEWAKVDLSTARKAILKIVQKNLFYNYNIDTVNIKFAEKIAEKFLSEYGEDATFLINSSVFDRDDELKIDSNFSISILDENCWEVAVDKYGIGYILFSALFAFDENQKRIGIFCKCESD